MRQGEQRVMLISAEPQLAEIDYDEGLNGSQEPEIELWLNVITQLIYEVKRARTKNDQAELAMLIREAKDPWFERICEWADLDHGKIVKVILERAA